MTVMEQTDMMLPGTVSFWVIYDRPRGYPEHYVLREWRMAGGSMYQAKKGSLHRALEDARAELLRRGLQRIGPSADDDPSILEVWR